MIAAAFIIVSALMILGSAALARSAREFWEATLLQVGSTLLLVPLVLVLENVFTRVIRESVREALSYSANIRGNADWETVTATLERVSLEQLETEVVVKAADQDLWLGFGTFKQHNQGVDEYWIMLYYSDPTHTDKPKFDQMVTWPVGTTLEGVLAKVSKIIHQNPEQRAKSKFDQNSVIAELRKAIEYRLG